MPTISQVCSYLVASGHFRRSRATRAQRRNVARQEYRTLRPPRIDPARVSADVAAAAARKAAEEAAWLAAFSGETKRLVAAKARGRVA